MSLQPNRATDDTRIEEQRRFPRLACHTPLQYRDIFKPHATYIGSLTQDLSAGGVKFQASEWLAVQHRLLVQLQLPGALEPIRTIAQVVWTRKHAHSDQYEIGVCFVEMTAYDRDLVAEFVDRGLHRGQ